MAKGKGTPSTTAGFSPSTTAQRLMATPARNMTPSAKGTFITPTAGFLDAANAGNIGADKNAATNDANT